MMGAIRILAVLAVAFALASCAPKSKFRTYNGPEVTRVEVHKDARKVYLLHDDKVLKSYDMALGFAPVGHKEFEGDGKTPEGLYYISFKKPDSDYHLSLKISYPNDVDRVHASTKGKSPGGDIFIHGGPKGPVARRDWTAGCIAVSDREIEEIYSMVRTGTPIVIFP